MRGSLGGSGSGGRQGSGWREGHDRGGGYYRGWYDYEPGYRKGGDPERTAAHWRGTSEGSVLRHQHGMQRAHDRMPMGRGASADPPDRRRGWSPEGEWGRDERPRARSSSYSRSGSGTPTRTGPPGGLTDLLRQHQQQHAASLPSTALCIYDVALEAVDFLDRVISAPEGDQQIPDAAASTIGKVGAHTYLKVRKMVKDQEGEFKSQLAELHRLTEAQRKIAEQVKEGSRGGDKESPRESPDAASQGRNERSGVVFTRPDMNLPAEPDHSPPGAANKGGRAEEERASSSRGDPAQDAGHADASEAMEAAREDGSNKRVAGQDRGILVPPWASGGFADMASGSRESENPERDGDA